MTAQDRPRPAPYGSWSSPITLDMVVAGAVSLSEPRLDGEDVYWLEGRASEAGRGVVVRRRADGSVEDVTPPDVNVRNMVHEYGGGSYTVADGVVYLSNRTDGRLYRQIPGSPAQPLTPVGAYRYADLQIDPSRSRLLAVREDHSAEGEPRNEIVAVAVNPAASAKQEPPFVLVSGPDFLSDPRPSPDGQRLCWLTWNHPDMPWDATELWVAEVGADGRLQDARRIAGGARESIAQPRWSPAGQLHFVSDRTGWWNLYRDGDKPRNVAPMEAEFVGPQWVFGLSNYGFDGEDAILCAVRTEGRDRLLRLPPDGGSPQLLDDSFEEIDYLHVAHGKAILIGGGATRATVIAALDLPSARSEILRQAFELTIDAAYLSSPEPISFTSRLGTAHGLYYPPANPQYQAPDGERPPLVVRSHGGPTASASRALNLNLQAFTSRGMAVVDVDYGGSTGYGRPYRERLNGAWGIVDVEDCVAAARYLVERGEVDPERLAIRGGSAGGYTTLAALTFSDVFRAGASYYGIGDLETMTRDTHKFESRYLDRLVGAYPERRDLYRERSPIHFTDRLACPLIIFQGLDDKVVPPAQAEDMVAALRAKGLPFAYLPFEGEDHGFRKAENIRAALGAEIFFYSRIFGFQPAGDIRPVPIENLPAGP